MHSPTGCPDRRQLQRFVAGLVSEEEATALESHVEDCAACLAALRELPPADSLSAALHGCAARPDLGPELKEAAERLLGRTLQPGEPTPPAGPAETCKGSGASAPGALQLPFTPPEADALDLRRYELLEQLGRGGMGEVYRSRDPGLGRDLALKVLAARFQGHAEMERRFTAEARITGALQHPSIVPVYNLGRLPDGRLYFTMKLVRGQTFQEMLSVGQASRLPGQAGTLAPRLAAFEQVCQAVAYAHSKGVTHRDLKPLNVMVGAFGEVQVMDWGLAKVLDRTDESSAEGSAAVSEAVGMSAGEPGPPTQGAVGTPEYMAPEQANGQWQRADERLDVFALGGILCTILTSRPPYHGGSAREVWRKAQRGDLTDAYLRLDDCGADAALVRLARDCLCPEVERRPRDAGAVAERVAAYQAGVQERLRVAEVERGAAQARAAEERKRRRLAVRLGAAVALLLAALAAGGLYLQWQRAEARARTARAEGETRSVLERASGVLEEGWREHDLAKLTQAKAEADQAVAIADSGAAGQAVRQEAGDFQKKAEERLRRARKNNQLLDALLNVAAPLETLTYKADTSGRMMAQAAPTLNEQYAAAFRRWGLDVDGPDEAEAVKRLGAEPESVRQEVVAALDVWTQAWQQEKSPEAKWRRLLRLAEGLDPSPPRRRLRALLLATWPQRPEEVAALVGAWSSWPALWARERASTWRRVQELRRRADPAREAVLTVLLLAKVCRLAGDAAGAERILRRALAARPGQVELLDALGRLLEQQGPGRLGEAVECYRAIRAVRPGLGVALGRALSQTGQPEAEEVLRDLVRRRPNNPELRLHLGVVLNRLKKPAEAEVAYRKAIDLDPDSGDAHNNLGIALVKQRKLAAAEAAFRKAIERKPDSPEPHHNLGLVLFERNKPDEAEAAFRQSLRFRPDDAGVHYMLGRTLYEQNRRDEAEAAYRRAIALKPNYADAHIELGLIWRDRRKPAEAEAAFRQAIRLKPTSSAAHNDLGLVLHDRNQPAAAEAAFRKAIDLDPANYHAHYNLGNALRDQKKPAEAEAAFRKAIAIQPDFDVAYNNLGSALREQKKLADAEAAYRKAVELKPANPRWHFNLGMILAERTKLAEAEAAFRKAAELEPANAYAHYNLGFTRHKRKKLADAETAYRRATELKPDYFDAHYTRLLPFSQLLCSCPLNKREPLW
jgi:Tfp pilus assembly protein PilF